jgi:hypothetical protein
MKEMPFFAALGNDTCTALVIDTLIWDRNDVIIEKENGRFCLTNICPEGGKRLITETEKPQILAIKPNPTSGDISIEFNIVEKGLNELLLVNCLGETVKRITYNQVTEFGKRTETLHLDELVSGQYFLMLKTPSVIERQIVMVVK